MLLFLDFDGVLHPDRSSVDLYFCRLTLLEPWLRKRPQIEVVISSSWREAHPLDELREFFSEDIRPRVVGATPVVRNEKDEREAEIGWWLRDNGHTGRPWAALDDQAFLFSPNCSRLALCCEASGLSQAELDRLDSILKSPGQRMSQRQVLEQRNIAAVLSGTTWCTVEDAGADEWLQDMRVFAIEQEGQLLVPAYAFDPHGEPYAVLAEVIGILNGYTPFRLAAWFESTSSTLSGWRPRELLASDPQAVIAAARSHRAGPQHG